MLCVYLLKRHKVSKNFFYLQRLQAQLALYAFFLG